YLLLGCDGVWERFTNQQVADFLLKRLPSSRSISQACAEFLDSCLAANSQNGAQALNPKP
ncbi:unnamed protein product, partial [Symbiodinium natans]